MINRIVYDGLEELKQALRSLPEELRAEGHDIVVGAARQARDEIIEGYPNVSDRLDKGVKMDVEASPHGVAVTIRSTARHADIFEYGTAVRQTGLGYNRGAMPAAHEKGMLPRAIRRRRGMYLELVALLQRKGLEVSGSAE